jgi:enediyne biosynthesis protein E4
LYHGRFEGSDKHTLIEAEHEGERLFPVRGLPQMAHALPWIGRKFTSFAAYSVATLEHVFPAEQLAAASRLEATELRSGVFLSQADGTFRFEPLPRLAQTAPIFGIAAGDVDGDGKADLCVVQNSYAPIPEVGRFDGGFGWVLRGDGRGTLSPVKPAESAFIVQGDAKALVRLDFDNNGWPDFFVTRNNGRSLALANTGRSERNSFAVNLRGTPGNPTAVGARVTIEMSDGTTQSAEVTAGSGYLSQSSPSLFFGYTSSHPPRSIHVRWPGGRTSSHPWTNAAHIALSPPET